MLFRQLFDRESSTYTYLIADEATGEAALIDPVRENVERDLELIEELGLRLVWILETHVHADHVTGAAALRERTGARTAASRHGASCADVKVDHDDVLPLGRECVRVLATPGHTNDSVSYVAGGEVFTGDALLIRGCGRTDFQNGDPETLWHSITEVLFALPDETRVWPGHDYRGRTSSTIEEERRCNPRIAGKTREQFVTFMGALALPRPKLIDVAVPANLQCGRDAADRPPS